MQFRYPSERLPALRFLTLLPGSRALKMWKVCRNQEVCGHFQASRRRCAVVYLLCVGHLGFAVVAARHPSGYSKQRVPTLHFPRIFHHKMADAKAKQHCCPRKTAPCLVSTLQLILLQRVTGKVYMLTYVNLWSFHHLKKNPRKPMMYGGILQIWVFMWTDTKSL